MVRGELHVWWFDLEVIGPTCRAETDDDGSSMEIGDEVTVDGTTNADADPTSAEAPKICSDAPFMLLEIIYRNQSK